MNAANNIAVIKDTPAPKIEFKSLSLVAGDKIPLVKFGTKANEILYIQTEPLVLDIHPHIVVHEKAIRVKKSDAPQMKKLMDTIEDQVQHLLPSYLKSISNAKCKEIMDKIIFNPHHFLKKWGSYDSNNQFIKIGSQIQFFDTQNRPLKMSELGYGRYVLLLQASEVYLGEHNNGCSASVQFRVIQMKYEAIPKPRICLIQN